MRFQSLFLCALLLGQPALAQDKAPTPRRLEGGDLRANFRSFDEKDKTLVDQRITASNNCPERVQIGGSTTPATGSAPLRIENRTVVMDSKIAVFCGT